MIMKAGENHKSAIGNRKSVLPPSSSGLGYQVLILETGVRLPLGVFFPTMVGKNGAPASCCHKAAAGAVNCSTVQLLIYD